MTIRKLLEKIDSLYPMPQENQTAKQIAVDVGRIKVLSELVEWLNQEMTIGGWTEEEKNQIEKSAPTYEEQKEAVNRELNTR